MNEHLKPDELATLRQKLAEAEKERDAAKADFIRAVNTGEAYAEKQERGYEALLATANADCAAMRETLLGIGEYWNGAEGSAVDACEETRARVDAALTRPTGQAILDELSAARKVCEIAQWQENGGMWPENYAGALDAYRAARKANTGANNGKL